MFFAVTFVELKAWSRSGPTTRKVEGKIGGIHTKESHAGDISNGEHIAPCKTDCTDVASCYAFCAQPLCSGET